MTYLLKEPTNYRLEYESRSSTLQRTVTHCNTQQRTATHHYQSGEAHAKQSRDALHLPLRAAHSYVWHNAFICVTWLIHMCDMTHSYVWHDSFICVTWLIHHVMTLNSFCVTWLFTVASSSCAFICVTWLIHVRLFELHIHIWHGYLHMPLRAAYVYVWVMSHIWMRSSKRQT